MRAISVVLLKACGSRTPIWFRTEPKLLDGRRTTAFEKPPRAFRAAGINRSGTSGLKVGVITLFFGPRGYVHASDSDCCDGPAREATDVSVYRRAMLDGGKAHEGADRSTACAMTPRGG